MNDHYLMFGEYMVEPLGCCTSANLGNAIKAGIKSFKEIDINECPVCNQEFTLITTGVNNNDPDN